MDRQYEKYQENCKRRDELDEQIKQFEQSDGFAEYKFNCLKSEINELKRKFGLREYSRLKRQRKDWEEFICDRDD